MVLLCFVPPLTYCNRGCFSFVSRVLAGKYLDPQAIPENSRMERFKGFMSRYRNSDCNEAVGQYAKVAEEVSEEAAGVQRTEALESWGEGR